MNTSTKVSVCSSTRLFFIDVYLTDRPELFDLVNLERLHLDNNSLSSLPLDISCLTNLTELTLTSNSFTSFPPAVLSLSNLRYGIVSLYFIYI